MASSPDIAVAPSDSDENIIQELVSLQQVPVMAKLQVLLRSICTRVTLQASKIEKAEEQGRNAALLRDEFEQFSKKALAELKAEKEVEQSNFSKLIEDKLKGLDDVAKQYGDVAAGLQGADLSTLKKLTTRLAAIEEASPGFLEEKLLPDISSSSEHRSVLPMNERVESLQSNFDDQSERINRLEDQIKELKKTLQDNTKANASDIEALQKICRNLRSDIEMLPILGVTAPPARLSVQETDTVNPDFKIALSDVHSRLQRKADSDIVDQLVRSTAQAKEGLEKMKYLYEELRKQMCSTVPSPSRTTSSSDSQDETTAQLETVSEPQTVSNIVMGGTALKSVNEDSIDEHIKYLEEEVRNMATQLAGKADRKDIDGLQIQMALLEGRHDKSSLSGTLSPDRVFTEYTPPSQEVPKMIQMQLQQDNETKSNPGQEINLGSDKIPMQTLERQEQSDQKERMEETPEAVLSSEFASLKSSYARLQLTLQKLQDLIATKADRNELLQLHDNMNQHKFESRRSSAVSQGNFDYEKLNNKYKAVKLAMDTMNDKIAKLEERSDLNVLISKRLENFAQPAATVQESSQGLDEMKDAINEHATRMMEYADTLLQMEALLASKADASGLKALRASIMELKKRNKDSQPGLHPLLGDDIKRFEGDYSIQSEGDRIKQLEGGGIIRSEGGDFIRSEGGDMIRLEGDAIRRFQGDDSKRFQGDDIRQFFEGGSALQGERSGHVMSPAEKVEKHEMMLNKLLKHMELLGTGILTLSGHMESDKLEPKALHEGCLIDGNGVTGNQNPQASVSTEINQSEPAHQENNNGTNNQCKVDNNHDALLDLEEALHEKLIKPKGDAEVLNKLAEEFLPLSCRMKELDDTIRSLRDNTAEKDELQKMKNYVKQKLEIAETAMLSGKGLPGFKCMSCAHRLDKLNPNRAEFVPTNCMRRQILPMHAAERIYHKEEHENPDSPREIQNKGLATNSKQLLSKKK